MTALDVSRQTEDHAGFSVEAVRAKFPGLHQQVRNSSLVYLDNAASSQTPTEVLDALMGFYTRDRANVHRGIHALSQRATDAFEAAREAIRAYINASDSREIVFTRGTTEAINLVAHSFGRSRLKPGDEVLITEMEHHSNIVPWQLACEATGAILKVIPVNDQGELILEQAETLIGDRTRIVSVVHISNALGTVNPVREIIRMAHARDIPVLVDGAQAVPHCPVDVTELDADFYAFSGHKMFGPTGIGVLYGKAALLQSLPPYQGGGDMIRNVTLQRSTWADIPARFEAGTPNIAGAIGLGAAVGFLSGLDWPAVMAYEAELLSYATERMMEVPGLRMIGTAQQKASVCSFVMDCAHPSDVGTLLDQFGIAVRTGHHCAEPLLQRYGLTGTVRASLALYNTRDEIDRLTRALHKVHKFFG